MGVRRLIESWPVYRQLTGDDPSGRGAAAKSARSAQLRPRTGTADRVVKSVCPFCAVGCGQNVYVTDEHVVQIEGDHDRRTRDAAHYEAAYEAEYEARSRDGHTERLDDR